MGKFRRIDRRLNLVWRVAIAFVRPIVFLTTKRDWRNGDRIPASGGVIVALNHVSHIDPVMSGHLAYEWGRMPYYLAKASLFKNKRFGKFLREGGQIPVDRAAGAAAFDEAVSVVKGGGLLVVYVEGSITKDPHGWPMVPKTGVARIALATGAPVLPVGQWGAQDLLPAYASKPKLFPRKTMHMNVGEPLSLAGIANDEAGINQATDLIMNEIVSLVEDLRGEKAPAERFDPTAHGLRAIGNPNKD